MRKIFRIGQLALTAMVLTACGGAGETGGGTGEAGGGTAVTAADAARGQKLYQQTCAMCHGYQGEGVQRLGKPIVDSEFVRRYSDEELVRFLIEGRAANHPDNTQGIPMPPRGGNPSLTDEDLAAIVAYMRSIS